MGDWRSDLVQMMRRCGGSPVTRATDGQFFKEITGTMSCSFKIEAETTCLNRTLEVKVRLVGKVWSGRKNTAFLSLTYILKKILRRLSS